MGARIPELRLVGKHRCSKCGDQAGPHYNVRPAMFRAQRVECWYCHHDTVKDQWERQSGAIGIALVMVTAVAITAICGFFCK